MSARPMLNAVNATIREILELLDKARNNKVEADAILRKIDEFEDLVDNMLYNLSPERITDERFNAALSSLTELADKLRELRAHVVLGRYVFAKRVALDVQETLRHTYRLLILIKAGSPTSLIFQVTPQFLREMEVSVPETIIHTSPMAAQIYNILVRKRQATVEELASELNIDDKTRDEFNRAVSQLISAGYARPFLTPDNRMLLKLSKR